MSKKLAFMPTLTLYDSYVAIYRIYILINPFTTEIFYVGQTMKELEIRLSGHLADSDSNKPKQEYIQNIVKQGGKPIIESIEAIKGTCYLDKMAVDEREKYWIRYYKAIGCNLLNSASSGNKEYHSYLRSLKAGETSWHYYYCGETRSGYKVYDVKRLESDGFRFTPDGYSTNNSWRSPEETGYNPWKNERFVKKVGYIRDPYDTLSYVPCYNDMNPDFYDDDY